MHVCYPCQQLRHEDCQFEASMAYTRVLALSQKAQMITITIIMIAIERNVSRCGEMWLRGMYPQLVSRACTVPQGNLHEFPHSCLELSQGSDQKAQVSVSKDPTVWLPYLAPVSCHPAGRRTAAQTAADASRRLILLWTLCSWECFRKVTALAQNNPMLESWTTFWSTLEIKTNIE